MENITKEFTYNLPDDQYLQTAKDKKTGTLTYNGPAKKFVVVDKGTNKLTNAVIDEVQFETYNTGNNETYAVEVDCDKDTLICAMVNNGTNSDEVPNLTEDVPGSDIPYVRDNPSLPDHTYEVKEVEYDISTNSFIKPFPWKKPYITWLDKISARDVSLKNADRRLSEDLPESVYTAVAEYKQYLRDFPVTFGAAWDITIGSSGTGYVVGDRVLISDPVYKNNTAGSDILITVTEVDNTGAVTAFSKSNAYAYEYHPEAGTYNNVFYTASASGTGAIFNMSKVKTVSPWKITPKENPLS